jgi:hypothetical protein|nr:MAG: Putative serine protease XkdF [Bacteriophage sp.]DAM16762.1 MAG TPA: hypothetical protein [Caudoviricetes sp.]
MATKLKNLKITKVDFVDDGANPEAHIRLFKSKDGVEPPHDEGAEKKPNIWKRLITAITKAAGSETDTSELESVIDDIQKSSESFGERIAEVKNRKIADEIWDICYALQSSLCSILNDEDMDGTSAATAMQESLDEFYEFSKEAISQWSSGKATNIVKKEEVTASDLEMMKSARSRLDDTIEKAEKAQEEPGAEEPKKKDQNKNQNNAKGAEEMKIDKSKLTPAELAFLQSIEKRYGEEEGAGAEGVTPPAQNTDPTPATGVGKSNTPAQGTDGGEDIYKGMHPAVRAELENLKKFREATEERELEDVAKKYEIIGKKKEELVPVLKSLKAAGGTAYTDMIAVLDGAVAAVEKSGAFTEIGKSGGAGTTDGAAWTKAETQAAEIMKSKNVTKAQALDEVFRNDPELAAECEKED